MKPLIALIIKLDILFRIDFCCKAKFMFRLYILKFTLSRNIKVEKVISNN